MFSEEQSILSFSLFESQSELLLSTAAFLCNVHMLKWYSTNLNQQLFEIIAKCLEKFALPNEAFAECPIPPMSEFFIAVNFEAGNETLEKI